MPTPIIPTTGRVVLFKVGPQDLADGSIVCNAVSLAMPALVAAVNEDGTVNLAVFDHAGKPFSRTSVLLVQPGDTVPTEEVTNGDETFVAQSRHCHWMDYQVEQATKAAASAPTPTPAPTTAPAPATGGAA